MKVGINDGCANGGMMDSLSIAPLESDPGWDPYYVAEVTEEEWQAWLRFLKLHAEWERFWNSKL